MGQGPLVLLLHGFPEFWYSWRHQLPALAAAGFRAVAPDLRGYNRSWRPEGVRAYRFEDLVGDVIGLMDALEAPQAHVIGHDWGGALAWAAAMWHPDRIDHLTILNSPHPVPFIASLRRPPQLAKSWYMALFQVPWLPERLMCARGARGLRQALRSNLVDRSRMPDADLTHYVQALGSPAAMGAGLNWYRAMLRYDLPSVRTSIRRIEAPTLLLWGEQDRVLGLELTLGLAEWIPHLQRRIIPDAGHFPALDTPDQVNQALVAFLPAPTPRAAAAPATPPTP